MNDIHPSIYQIPSMMSMEDRKVEASRKRWNRIPNPRAFFKPLRMVVHKIGKSEAEDIIGAKFRKEFGNIEDFLKNIDPKHLTHDYNHDYFAIVTPKHTPIHLDPKYNQHLTHNNALHRPTDKNDLKYSSRRSLNNDPQNINIKPQVTNHHRTSLPLSDVQVQEKGKQQDRSRRLSESINNSWKNAFDFSSQAEVYSKVKKFVEEVSLPNMMSPLPHKASPPPTKIMTKLQQIELSDNPLDFSVSEDELNPEADDFDGSDPPLSAGFADDAKESDCPSEEKEELPKLSPLANDPIPRLSPTIKLEVSLEDGEIDEDEFRKGHPRTSSKVRQPSLSNSNQFQPLSLDDASRPHGMNAFPDDNNHNYGDNNKKDAKVDVDDLEEGEIEDEGKQSYVSSSPSSSGMSSSRSSSSESSYLSEFSPPHSKHALDHVENNSMEALFQPSDKNQKINKQSDEKEIASVKSTPVDLESHVTQDQSFCPNLPENSSQNILGISKSSAFEPPVKKSSMASHPKSDLECSKEKLRVEPANVAMKSRIEEHQQVSPVRVATPAASEKKEHSSNVQKPKHDKPSKSQKAESKSVKLKIKNVNGTFKNVNGTFKANEEVKPKSETEQVDVASKSLEKLKEEKKDQKCDAKVKKQPEQRFAEVVNNQQGISFVSAIQSSNVARKKNAATKENSTKESNTKENSIKESSIKDINIKDINIKDINIKDINIKEKKESKVDVKSKKRKSDDSEKDINDKLHGATAKMTKLAPKGADVPLVLRFDTNLFAKLEKTEKKRKNEDEAQQASSKRLKLESDLNSKEKLNDSTLKKKRVTKKINPDKPTSQEQTVNKKPKKTTKPIGDEVETSPAAIDDSDKKQKIQEIPKKDSDVPVTQGDFATKKSLKKPSKPSSKTEKSEQTNNKLKIEEILRKTNEALSRGVVKGKDTSTGKKSSDSGQNVSSQLLSLPNNDAATSSKSNSPREKHKKESLKNASKVANDSLPSKNEQQVFRGTFKVTSVPDVESCLTDDMKEKQVKLSETQNKNQSQVESIHSKAEAHLNKSHLLQAMAKMVQGGNGGRPNFVSMLNSIESHVYSFLGAVELSKFNEDSFNIRHYNQLIGNMETSIKELEVNEDRTRLNFLLNSFRVMVNDYYFNQTFNKDKDLNETAIKEIQMTDHKNSPRSSPDSTCANSSTANSAQVANANQQSVGNVDASSIKSLNQAKINLSFLFPYLYTCNSYLKVLFKLASDPSCQNLCDRQHLPVDMIHADLQTWTKWFEDTMARVKTIYGIC